MMPLHKGDDTFMSDEQFERFYWPSLRRLFLAMIEEGLVPFPFAEGRYNSRLKQITDTPRSGVVWYFDQTDMAQAKKVLGNVSCIVGNVPSSIVMTGTSTQVKENCRRLIETCAPGGGTRRRWQYRQGDIANLRVMMEAAYEYVPTKIGNKPAACLNIASRLDCCQRQKQCRGYEIWLCLSLIPFAVYSRPAAVARAVRGRVSEEKAFLNGPELILWKSLLSGRAH
jgi:hypothetical protein